VLGTGEAGVVAVSLFGEVLATLGPGSRRIDGRVLGEDGGGLAEAPLVQPEPLPGEQVGELGAVRRQLIHDASP
jgi:hypothetical protein